MAPWLEQAWLTRYLDGLLAEDEAAWFEAYALDKPKLLAMIDADTRLRAAISSRGGAALPADANPAADNSPADPGASPGGDLPRRLRTFTAAPTWMALAAALVLGLGVGRLAWRADGAAPLIANPMHVVYDTMRGAAAPPRVEQANSLSAYVLVQVAVPPGAERVSLQIAGTATSLLPDANGFVSFLLPKAQLASNNEARIDYTVDGRSESRPISFAVPNERK